MQTLSNAAVNPLISLSRGRDGRVSILVVGDDPRVIRTMRGILEGMGRDTVLVTCGKSDCLRQVEEVQPALVLLDMHGPTEDGLEVLRQLRAQASGRSLPVLMISADAQFEQMVACFEAGASGFLIKPFDEASLYRQVRNAIAQHGVDMLQRDVR